MSLLQHFFQILPIILACTAAVVCSIRYSSDRRKSDRTTMLLSVLSSVLLIVAQTSWWATYLIENSLQGTVFANYIWTVFNSLVMLTFIISANPLRK